MFLRYYAEDVPLSSSCMLFYGLLDVDSQAKQTQLLCMHSCSCEINQIILKMTAPRVPFQPPPGECLVYCKQEWAFVMMLNDDSEEVKAWKWSRDVWEEAPLDRVRLHYVESQLENMNFSFASTLVMSGFLFSFLMDLRLAKIVRRAQAQFELHLGRQVAVSRNFRHVPATAE